MSFPRNGGGGGEGEGMSNSMSCAFQMPCCEWPSLDVPGDPAFLLAPPISMTVLCIPCQCAVGSIPPQATQFLFLVSVSSVFPVIRGPPFVKSPMLSQATVGAKLSLNPHTWYVSPSLSSKPWLRIWACWDLFSPREQKAGLSPVTERTRVFVEKGRVVQNLHVFQLCLHRVEINVGSGSQASSSSEVDYPFSF